MGRLRRIIHIRSKEQRPNGIQNLNCRRVSRPIAYTMSQNIMSWSTVQDAVTNPSLSGDIWMENRCDKICFRGKSRVVVGHIEIHQKRTTCVHGVRGLLIRARLNIKYTPSITIFQKAMLTSDTYT